MLDQIATIVILVIIGVGAGIFGSILGVGGGIMIVPALTFMGLPPAQTASTSLFAVASTSVSSTIEYSRQKRIDYKIGMQMAASAIPGAVIGAFMSAYLSTESFRLYFGILLLLVGLYIVYKNSILKDRTRKIESRRSYRTAAVLAAAFAAGVISSLFGVGGGIIFMPAMLIFLGMAMHRAAPTSQLALMIASITGVLTHSLLDHPDYLQALVLSIGAFLGAQIGAKYSRSVKEILLQRILGMVLIAVAAKFILDWFSK